jgi:hypothetical protein
MAISFTRYVDITSGVGGGAGVRARDLILRLFSSNPLVPSDAIVEMTNANDVRTYFGSSSPEYARALFYFGFVSKLIKAPEKISFARWAETSQAPRIYGRSASYSLMSIIDVTNGAINLTIGGYSTNVTGINFSAAATLSNVASILQTAIRAVTLGGANWTSATVTYNATEQRFELTGGVVGDAAISSAAPASGTDIRALIGWDSTAIFSPGVDAQEPVDSFASSVELSDNFGTFSFVSAVTLPQIIELAQQNDTYNVKFIGLYRVALADAASYYAALSGFSGVGVTLAPLANEFPELLPAAILAATDYGRRNSVQNYMFYQAALSPSVLNNADADLLDQNRVNYYGRTQTAGQNIDFYQRGVLMGLPTDPVDMNVYANEMWLKDAAGAAIMGLLLSLARVSANATGRGQILAILQSIIEQATLNGTISVGKPLNTTQKLFIGNITGDDNAWQQVFNLGYWLDCAIESYVTVDSRTEYKAVYTLIYSKDDAIRKVEGTHVLI